MKKVVILLFSISVLLFAVYAIANVDAPEQEFTKEQLAEYNGKGDSKAYVAVDGIVYDVTLIKAWSGGEHKHGLRAGKDHSEAITKSPHGKGVLTKLPKVGMYRE